MEKYKIYAGLGGSFGGADYIDTLDFENYDEAMEFAFRAACEKYNEYAGLYGLRTVEEIMEQDETDEEEAIMIYNEERESWLDYNVELDDGIPEE